MCCYLFLSWFRAHQLCRGNTLRFLFSDHNAYIGFSLQNLLKSTADTTAASFLSDCNNFENDLQTTYGLNKYHTALTMGYVLSQNTLYLTLDKFYSSGCFVNGRNLLKTMGINVFDKKPSS